MKATGVYVSVHNCLFLKGCTLMAVSWVKQVCTSRQTCPITILNTINPVKCAGSLNSWFYKFSFRVIQIQRMPVNKAICQ